MRQQVIVVGAGVAGLTAAHELSERDFDVHVIERRLNVGGKALSRRVRIAAGGDSLPAEHGFRFFPGWYQHLPNTLSRISTTGKRRDPEREPNVLDSLVTIHENKMHWSNRAAVPVPMHLPRNVGEAESLATLFAELGKLDLAPAELGFFFMRLGQFLVMPEAQRRAKLQKITWWEYLEANTKSRAFKDLICATTRTMVAAKATEASAYTICRLAIRTLADAVGSVDRVLDGPTSEKWLDIWRQKLVTDGVTFHHGWELEDIVFDARGERRIERLCYTHVASANLARLRRLLAPLAQDFLKIVEEERQGKGGTPQAVSLRERFEANWRSFLALKEELESSLSPQLQENLAELTSWLAVTKPLLERCAELRKSVGLLELTDTREQRHRVSCRLVAALIRKSRRDAENGAPEIAYEASVRKFLDKCAAQLPKQPNDMLRRLDEARALFDPYFVQWREDDLRKAARELDIAAKPPEVADFYVMALPVEQMAYHVNRSVMLTTHDPGLARIVQLANHTDWMAGIQFYLCEDADLGQGHMIFMDSEWALTAIEQVQFWRGVGGVPRNVKAIVSVDISAWDRRGRFVNKEAFNCTDDEIAHEVWAELKASVRSERGQHLLHDGMLIGGKLSKGSSFVLDESIAELYDRRKQGAYERARSVRPSVTRDRPGSDMAIPYVYGPRLRFNVEPLLINRIGSHDLRPEAKTKIENMFLASDYVLTETDLACMEGANEAARRAVNALLDQARSNRERCELYEFSLPGGLLKQLTAFATLSSPADLAEGVGKMAAKAADTATKLVSEAFGSIFSLWEKRR
jgi:hypothetical protein